MMECYSAIKRNEILMPATVRMNLRNILPSERCQTSGFPCDSICMSVQNRQVPRGSNQVSEGWGTGGRGMTALAMGFLLRVIEMI